MTKQTRFFLYTYLMLAGLGFSFVLGNLAQRHFTVATGREWLFSLVLLALFFLPFYLFIGRTAKKLSVCQLILWLSIFGGAFIAAWLSFSGSSLLEIFSAPFFGDPQTFNEWRLALSQPFAETFFQTVTVFLVLCLFNSRALKPVFIAGLGVGLGFQMVETVTSLADETLVNHSAAAALLTTILDGLASHTIYTATAAVGIFLLLSKTSIRKERHLGFWLLLSTLLCHFLKLTVWYNTSHRINLLAGLFFTIQMASFIEAYRFVMKEPEMVMERARK